MGAQLQNAGSMQLKTLQKDIAMLKHIISFLFQNKLIVCCPACMTWVEVGGSVTSRRPNELIINWLQIDLGPKANLLDRSAGSRNSYLALNPFLLILASDLKVSSILSVLCSDTSGPGAAEPQYRPIGIDIVEFPIPGITETALTLSARHPPDLIEHTG